MTTMTRGPPLGHVAVVSSSRGRSYATEDMGGERLRLMAGYNQGLAAMLPAPETGDAGEPRPQGPCSPQPDYGEEVLRRNRLH